LPGSSHTSCAAASFAALGAIVGFSFGQVTGATFDIDGGRQLGA